jgi:predicted nucleotidyltransferase
MDKETALGIAREFILKMKTARWKVGSAYLFGSASRGTGNEDSDIDDPDPFLREIVRTGTRVA